MEHHNMTNAELRRVKEQLNESSMQLAQAQQEAQLQTAQIEQQVYCDDARVLSLCVHASIDTISTGEGKRQGAPGCLSWQLGRPKFSCQHYCGGTTDRRICCAPACKGLLDTPRPPPCRWRFCYLFQLFDSLREHRWYDSHCQS
jgi:hypothetical protein